MIQRLTRKIAIMTDTNSSISVLEGTQLGVFVLPMPVLVGTWAYTEGKDLSMEQLFSAMTQGKPVHTSQPSPAAVISMWEKLFAAGYDKVLYIPMSSSLSGSCHTAKQLALDYTGRVYVADTGRVSAPQRSAVLDALNMVRKGMDAEEILHCLESNGPRASIYIALDTLNYLTEGGRVPPSAATMATVLNLKPILRVGHDALTLEHKVRGTRRAAEQLLNLAQTDLATTYCDIPHNQIALLTAGSLSPDKAAAWKSQVQATFPDFMVQYTPLPCSLCCHTGPDSFGIGIALRCTVD